VVSTAFFRINRSDRKQSREERAANLEAILSLTVSKRLNDPKILKDPWNQKPYLFDAQKNRFFSVGLDLHPYTADDIFLTIDLH